MKNTLMHNTKEKAKNKKLYINAIIVFLIMLFLFQYSQEGKYKGYGLIKEINKNTNEINYKFEGKTIKFSAPPAPQGHNNTTSSKGKDGFSIDPATNPMMNKKEDNFNVLPEDTEEAVKNGDAPFMTGAKERRTRGGLLQGAVSLILTFVVIFFGYPMLFVYLLLTSAYLANPNDKLEAAYRKGDEARTKDKKTGISKVKNEIIYKMFTLDKVFFVDLPLLDVNVFKKIKNGDNTGANGLRNGVAIWSSITRIIAVALSFISLVLGSIMLMVKTARITGKPATIGDVKDFLTNMVIAIIIALLINFALAAILYVHDALLAVMRVIRLKLFESRCTKF